MTRERRHIESAKERLRDILDETDRRSSLAALVSRVELELVCEHERAVTAEEQLRIEQAKWTRLPPPKEKR